MKILHEDDAIIIINKPSGLPTTSTKDNPESVASLIAQKWPELAAIGFPNEGTGIVHRLDNDTSGILLVAKTQAAFDFLRDQFDRHTIIKKYLALVIGTPPTEGKITTPIAHHPKSAKKMIACQTAQEAAQLKANTAKTAYKVMERFPNHALLKIFITTGVRHQIRVHLSSIGYPLAGDALYQKPKHAILNPKNLTHHFLHAASLRFIHPSTDQEITIDCKFPVELKKCLDTLRITH